MDVFLMIGMVLLPCIAFFIGDKKASDRWAAKAVRSGQVIEHKGQLYEVIYHWKQMR